MRAVTDYFLKSQPLCKIKEVSFSYRQKKVQYYRGGTMSFEKIHKDLDNQIIYPFYVLYGVEEYIIEATKNKIVRTVLAEDELDFNYVVYDLSEAPIQIAVEDAQTLPFLGNKRVVVVKEPIFLTAAKDTTKIDHDLATFEAYINNPSPDTVFIIVANYEKLDERKKLVKLLKKQGAVLHAQEMDEKTLLKWVDTRFKKNKMTIEEAAKLKLIQLVGNQLMSLANEIDKISLYLGKDSVVTEKDIDTLVARALEQNIFLLIDHVVQRKLEEALRIYHDLLELKEEPIRILALLAQQFRLIYLVKVLAQKGYGQKNIASTLKIHPYRVKLALNHVRGFTETELEKIVNKLADADYEMKMGKMDKKLLLELLIVEMTTNEAIQQG